MGRGCSLDEWEHFQKLPDEGRVSNSSYWYVQCRHCVIGFEQKQLLNPPLKLTGRRSAMRAHLKACPIYATQYQMEQLNIAIPPKDNNNGEDTSSGMDRRAKRKRETSRGKDCLMEEWTHFTRLQDDGYIGNSNFYYARCKHCERAYDQATADQKGRLVPEKLVGRREKMRKHLALCPHFKAAWPLRGPNDGRSAGEVTATSTAAGVPSNRLALDEWQYFTRLERKKNSAYYYARCNFCQQAFERAPESMKAAMKPTIIMGRKGNMQTHLTKCLHIPKEAVVITKRYETGYSTNLGGGMPTTPQVNRKEPKCTKCDVATASLDYNRVHCALVRMILEHHLPFEWVQSDSVQHLFDALAGATGSALVPSTTALRTRILEETHSATLFSELTKLQDLISLKLGTAAFSKNTVDSFSVTPMRPWPVMIHCNLSVVQQLQVPVIEGVVTNGKATVPLSFIRAQNVEAAVEAALAHNHSLEVARWLDEHIRLCVAAFKMAPSAVVLPYNSIIQRAVNILRSPKRWPQVVFLPNIEDMLQFSLLKLLATAEMFTVVSMLIEIWQLESMRTCLMERLSGMDGGARASPFCDWESCTTLIQALLDHKTSKVSTKKGAANAKKTVGDVDRSLLERVCNLLHAFTRVFSSCRAGLTLAEAMVQFGVLYTASEGFTTVQLALEVVWGQMEQPLFVLAHALNPRLRLRKINSTAITKLSTLSDLSVSYFVSLFGHKPNSLREEVTAYLDASQRVFSTEFVAEFSVMDDYFCCLSDNYPSLSVLMKVLHSFSSVSLASRILQNGVSGMYTKDEQLKLGYLRDRWGIASTAALVTKSRITDRGGAAMLNAGCVVDEWKLVLKSNLHERGVDFSLLENRFNGVEDSDISVDVNEHGGSNGAGETHGLKLPFVEFDNALTLPSGSLRTEFNTKVPLKELFKSSAEKAA